MRPYNVATKTAGDDPTKGINVFIADRRPDTNGRPDTGGWAVDVQREEKCWRSVVRRCKLDPRLKSSPSLKFFIVKMITALSA